MSDQNILFDGERAIPFAPDMDPTIMEEHWFRYRFAKDLIYGKVLDCACGVGYGSELITWNALSVTGVDISEAAIKFANGMYKRDNTYYFVADVTQMPLRSTYYDVVVSFETLEHIRNGTSFLKEITRVLKPDGILIMSIPIGGPAGNVFHVSYYQRGLFYWFLLRYFQKIEPQFQRGTKIFHASRSPYFYGGFTNEYMIAVCKTPYKNNIPFVAYLRSILYIFPNNIYNRLVIWKRWIESNITRRSNLKT